METRVLLLVYLAGCALIAAGAALVCVPAGLVVAGALAAGTAVKIAATPPPAPDGELEPGGRG